MKKITALILLLATVILTLSSCGVKCLEVGEGECEYYETRNTEGRDIRYAEMCVTGYGKIVLLLDRTTAPETVDNFISLAEDGFYDGLTFHRIMNNFMIQGGDPNGDGSGGSKKTIKGEFDENGHPNDILHKKGVISMARSNAMDSASSQFFICNADAYELNGKYAAFGYVIAGLDVVDNITSSTLLALYYYYGSYFNYWLTSANGAVPEQFQPTIDHVRIIDGYTPEEKPEA